MEEVLVAERQILHKPWGLHPANYTSYISACALLLNIPDPLHIH